MRLTGNMVLELTDVVTGGVERVEESNMVTNAVNDLFNTNPFAVFYNAGNDSGEIEWKDNLLPICPNMIGGILLFPGTLTEGVNNIYPFSANMPVGYASNDVNTTANTKRGSMNLTESKYLNGYDYLLPGDVLLYEGHHTATNLGIGKYAKSFVGTS